MLVRIFWTLLTLEAAVLAGLIIWTFTAKHWGPEGPVGAWLVLVVPPLMLGVPLIVFLMSKSDLPRLIAVGLLVLPLIPFLFGPLLSKYDEYKATRSIEGDATFAKSAERELAHAFRAHNAELVKSLIPKVGDVNAGRGNDGSLFRFCMTNLDPSDASLDIVKAMLGAGANAKAPMAGGTLPLYWGINHSAAMTQMLLDAGADPNTLDSSRPIWWEAMEGDFSGKKFPVLKLLLDRGADLTLRDSGNGPVGFAADRKNWRAAWLLIQQGAAWKGEEAFHTPIPRLLEIDLASRRGSNSEIPEELPKLIALYEGDQARQ